MRVPPVTRRPGSNHQDGSGIRDASMIGAAQHVEPDEIAYGTVRSMAELLGQNEIAHLLQQTLDEEGNADKKLTQIAVKVNKQVQHQAA